MSGFLQKSDYDEPCCPLNMHPETARIPISRVIEKLDEYLSRNDYVSAEHHLSYWLAEAENAHDLRGKLTVLNEQIGLFRKLGHEAEGLRAVKEALSLADSLEIENTVTYGTTMINAATAYKAFGRAADALSLYQKAQKIYESSLSPEDARLGGLYNNMALTLTALGNYRESEAMFKKALSIMEKQEHGEGEMAITCLNLADLVSAEIGMEAGEQKIEALLEKAETLLNTEGLPKDGNYAFICEKCAPIFGYYGYFLFEKELAERARAIYERS